MTRNEYIVLTALIINGGTIPGRNLYWNIANLKGFWRWFYSYGSFYIMMRELSERGWVQTINGRDEDGVMRSFGITDDGRSAVKEFLATTIKL